MMNSSVPGARFSTKSIGEIEESIKKATPVNPIRSNTYVMKQFDSFCKERRYTLNKFTSIKEIASVLTDWAYNMKKSDGTDYKETVIKVLWNSVAKQLVGRYFENYGITFDPFTDVRFTRAQQARDAKRKELQTFNLEKRKRSSSSLTDEEYQKIKFLYNEDSPSGLQKKFHCIAAYELCWRGGEGPVCRLHYFKEEIDNSGQSIGRYQCNPVFSKTEQGGAKKIIQSKFLATNIANPDVCPVRLLRKVILKRPAHVMTDRLFLTANPSWKNENSKGWYKSFPVGVNEMVKWVKHAAEEMGFNTKTNKVSNHSLRSTAISHLAKRGVGETQLIKISGHSSITSIKPYVQLDSEHHAKLIQRFKEPAESSNV